MQHFVFPSSTTASDSSEYFYPRGLGLLSAPPKPAAAGEERGERERERESMSKGYVEIDFFQMEKQNNASSKPCSTEHAPSSSGGIQSIVSRINPRLLKTVISQARFSDSVAAWPTTSSNPPSPIRTASPPGIPVFNMNPASRCSSPAAGIAPLTIFYNGTVATFDVPRDKAEAIMRMAETAMKSACTKATIKLDGAGDRPNTRRKSLQRFLEKRRERLAWASPYHKVRPILSLVSHLRWSACDIDEGD